MIEEFCIIIIRELGSTGVLICGLYFVLYIPLRKIAHHIEVINHNSTETKILIHSAVQLLKEKLNG